MIRHQLGNEYLLFTQDDHARLSGKLAEQFGNNRFAQPEPREQVIKAIAMHDAGWQLHDESPTLNKDGMPLHVFETPIPLAVKLWAESVKRAVEVDTYTGLLVSLHVFALSAIAYQHHSDPQQKQHSARELFELNKFQQLQIEQQEQIRNQLGLRTDMALSLGLAPRGTDLREDILRFHYQVLRTMDQISLAVLCGGRPFSTIDDVSPRPGVDPLDFRVSYPSAFRVSLHPWPFAVDAIELPVPVRRVPAKVYTDAYDFRMTYKAAQQETQMVKVSR